MPDNKLQSAILLYVAERCGLTRQERPLKFLEHAAGLSAGKGSEKETHEAVLYLGELGYLDLGQNLPRAKLSTEQISSLPPKQTRIYRITPEGLKYLDEIMPESARSAVADYMAEHGSDVVSALAAVAGVILPLL